jgi:Outer membrane protein beta-barrel domain
MLLPSLRHQLFICNATISTLTLLYEAQVLYLRPNQTKHIVACKEQKIFMIKKFNIIFAVFTLCNLVVFAQDKDAEIIKTKKSIFTVNNQYKKPSRDYVMIQGGFNTWLLPSASPVKIRERGHDISVTLNNEFPFGTSNFSFAAGLGIASSNVYLNAQTLSLTDTSKYATFKSDTNDYYKRFKISLNYFEVPLEFRYFGNKDNRNRGFKASLGVRVGTLINAHTKGVRNIGLGNFKDKESSRRFFETWRIMPIARVGWGNFSIYGAYQINEVFKVNNTQGLGARPLSFGLCISGL